MTLRSTLSSTLVALLLAAGCDGAPPDPSIDSGPSSGFDAGTITLADGNVIQRDAGRDSGGPTCTWEICGDFIDQNCDGRDTSCGDSDLDGIPACRVGEAPPDCDCDDARIDVRPPFGAGVPGAPEVCDGVDNDCNGRVDEAAQCCAACMALDDPARGDVCTASGACDCTTEPGDGPCGAGQTCCSAGCVDLATDFDNCGYCNTQCTPSADHCEAGNCRCGDGPVCDLDYACTGGSC
jgi:hypothetical protein